MSHATRHRTDSGSSRRFVDVVVAVVIGLAGWYLLSTSAGPSTNEGEPAAVPNPDDVYDPVAAGEPLPDGYVRVTDRDRINPIYEPRLKNADETDWPDDTLVLGVALDGDAKAYPIRVLNFREMVLDRLGGTPILATW